MYFLVSLRVALRSLLANKLRSFLAVLGIIIGVAAVIGMLAIGAGARSEIVGRIQSMGTDLLIVRPGQAGSRGVFSGTRQNLTVEDALSIVNEVDNVAAVAPVVQGMAQVKYYQNNASVTVVGATDTYLTMRNFEIAQGRSFSPVENDRMLRVAIIGPSAAEDLFGNDDALDAIVKVNGINFRVIGVTKSKGDQGWFNPDSQIIVPYLTAMKSLFGLDHLREIDVQGAPGTDQEALTAEITRLLRRRHRLEQDAPNDFNISNQAEMLETMTTVTRTFTILLGSVGGISLLVGGIGIMNIMLVTVTERTREIGVRKAIGAKERDILRQFLLESVFMSTVGGLIGILFGAGAAAAIGVVSGFGTQVQAQSIVMAMSFAVGVGVFFGYYPARRAALMNPVDALRYE